jgi:murein DD-endopeptidase MepM/ murein hydrolase activator NlpD
MTQQARRTLAMTGRQRSAAACGIALVYLLVLACAPDLASQHPGVRTQRIAWQCPTPSPVPTVRIGWDAWTEINPEGTEEAHREPIYSTPVPTATPYIRGGPTHYMGHRIAVGPLVLLVERDGHAVLVTVENTSRQPVELHFLRSQVRTVRIGDRKAEGSWTPIEDGPGLYPPRSKIKVPLTFHDLPGEPHTWGMPFASGQLRTGSSGMQQVWWVDEGDPHGCDKPGGPPTDAHDGEPFAGVPDFGRGGWPVPVNTSISRGYGCHSYWTDKPGAAYGCPSGWYWHDGVDFACSGCTAYAPVAAHVVFAGSTGDCAGNWVMLRDAHGYTYSYYHLQRWLVNGGTEAERGQPVGIVGTTGCSTGDHLHFKVVGPDGRERNPFNVLDQHPEVAAQ